MSKILVSYFSATGKTKGLAERFAKLLNGDLFEIEPVVKYTEADLDWTNKESRSSIEMNDNIKPDLAKKVDDLSLYDTILLGFPIWWYKEPTIIDKFLEENNLEGKKVYVFVTSGSSSIDSTFKSIKNNFPGLTFVDGKRFALDATDEDIINFVK